MFNYYDFFIITVFFKYFFIDYIILLIPYIIYNIFIYKFSIISDKVFTWYKVWKINIWIIIIKIYE